MRFRTRLLLAPHTVRRRAPVWGQRFVFPYTERLAARAKRNGLRGGLPSPGICGPARRDGYQSYARVTALV